MIPSEYEVRSWNYKDFDCLNPENNWFTPFDPRVEVRLHEHASYKYWAKQNHKKYTPWQFAKKVMKFERHYKAIRSMNSFGELMEFLEEYTR